MPTFSQTQYRRLAAQAVAKAHRAAKRDDCRTFYEQITRAHRYLGRWDGSAKTWTKAHTKLRRAVAKMHTKFRDQCVR